jgi:type II secretory pathway pseudopilin PulG
MKKNAFTLVELLVVIGTFSVIGIILTTIFTRSLRGTNKSQAILAIKQNGQSVFDNLDKKIRSAENIVCPVNEVPDNTLVLLSNGVYSRYRFIPARLENTQSNECVVDKSLLASATNGCLVEDFPQKGELSLTEFVNLICGASIPILSPTPITDTDPKTGVSFEDGKFIRSKAFGSKDIINIQVTLTPGISSAEYKNNLIEPVLFETSIQLR